MFKELLALALVAYLCPHAHTLGTECGGKDLPHSHQNDHWLRVLKHEESSPFNNNPGTYKVFRNVKDFGAKGDGVTDDSLAINLAISDGDRCGIGCGSSTISPAIVYFPPGKYLIQHTLLQFYFTQFIGDPINVPELIMAPNYDGDKVKALITSDEYIGGPAEIWTNQNNFYREVRNFVIDLTKVDAAKEATAIHWQVAQATSITNVHVKMLPNSKHQGIWMENGSGGYMSDLVFEGGNYGMWVGNQQFTSRNITIRNANTAIFMNWNWGWTFKGIKIENCKTGIEMTAGGAAKQGVGSLLLMDSEIKDTPVGVLTVNSATSLPAGAGSLILDNVKLTNVQKAVANPGGQALLAGGSKTIASWGQGRFYDQSGKGEYRQATLTAANKPAVLLDNQGNFFERPKPQYTDVAMGDFISVKSEGAKGDGVTDDTAALKKAFSKWAGCKVIYIPAGDYVVTDTVLLPAGTRVVGEVWSVIMATGAKFADANNPKPVFQIGNPGETGIAEMSEMLFSSEGPVPGAIMLQINLKESVKGGVGLGDTHFRIGGGKGTRLQSGQCGRGGAAKPECQGAFLMLHVAATGSVLVDNMWAWVADHDLDGPTQVSLYNGRGVLIESKEGPVWMYGTSSEHSVFYQYNIANAKNVMMGMIQTETPYYQAYPPAPEPFKPIAKYNDPDYSACEKGSLTCPMAWGLRIVNSEHVYVYGAGLYNFFQNYDQACLKAEHCQDNMLSIEKSPKNIFIYNLNTKASDNMVSVDGKSAVKQADNRADFCSTIAGFVEK
jgi:glucan 1,3-beta-glucosidase